MLKIHLNQDRCRKYINTEIERERERLTSKVIGVFPKLMHVNVVMRNI